MREKSNEGSPFTFDSLMGFVKKVFSTNEAVGDGASAQSSTDADWQIDEYTPTSSIRDLIDAYKNGKGIEEITIDVASNAIGGMAMQSAKDSSSEAIKEEMPKVINMAMQKAKGPLKSYVSGKISRNQCVKLLCQQEGGGASSHLLALAKKFNLPMSAAKAVSSCMACYALASASYKILAESLKEARLARERRIRIEAEVAESIAMLRKYRAELEAHIANYLKVERDFFDGVFANMETALRNGDANGYIAATNSITRKFGKRPLYENVSQFDSLMASDESLKF